MKRVLAILVAFAFLVAQTPGDDKNSPSANDIIGKYLEAVGGKQAITKFKSRVALGTVKREGEPDEQFAIVSEAPNRVSARYIFKQYDWQLTYDGGKSLVRPHYPRTLAETQEKQEQMVASGFLFNDISLFNALIQGPSESLKFEAKGTKKLGTRSAYVVDAALGKTQVARLYFDVETYMWVRTDYGKVTKADRIGPFTNDVQSKGVESATVDFYIETSDFRTVDGVKLPFKFVQIISQPTTKKLSSPMVGTITEYRHNIPIDPKMFQ